MPGIRDRIRPEQRSEWSGAANDADATVDLAVNNALGNLTGYPHGQEQVWHRHVSVVPSQVMEVLQRWRLPPAMDPMKPCDR